MTWQAISTKELEALIQQELEVLSEDLRKKFDVIQVPLYDAKCMRGQGGEEEPIFVIAQSENKLLIFDDVEEDFAIVDLTQQGEGIFEIGFCMDH